MENTNRAKEYLELFAQLREKVSDEASAVVILQEIGKDGRVEKMRNFPVRQDRQDATVLGIDIEQPATAKQLSF